MRSYLPHFEVPKVKQETVKLQSGFDEDDAAGGAGNADGGKGEGGSEGEGGEEKDDGAGGGGSGGGGNGDPAAAGLGKKKKSRRASVMIMGKAVLDKGRDTIKSMKKKKEARRATQAWLETHDLADTAAAGVVHAAGIGHEAAPANEAALAATHAWHVHYHDTQDTAIYHHVGRLHY